MDGFRIGVDLRAQADEKVPVAEDLPNAAPTVEHYCDSAGDLLGWIAVFGTRFAALHTKEIISEHVLRSTAGVVNASRRA
jgi:hypothetical protein